MACSNWSRGLPYHLPVPTLPDSSTDGTIKLERWLTEEHAEFHAGTVVAIIVFSGMRYEVRANGDGFLIKRLVKTGAIISRSTPLAIIAADGESIPYGKPHSVAHRITENIGRHGRRESWRLRSWRVVERIPKTPLHPNTTTRGVRQGLIARLIVYGIILVVGASNCR